jgi:hypothetical protein
VPRRHALGLAAVLFTALALELFRRVWFEPRAIGLACLHATAPSLICATRTGIGLLTHFQVFGAAALVLGILAFATARFTLAVLAVCVGVAGLIDYNISWGMLGAALGGWTWLSDASRGTAQPLGIRMPP